MESLWFKSYQVTKPILLYTISDANYEYSRLAYGPTSIGIPVITHKHSYTIYMLKVAEMCLSFLSNAFIIFMCTILTFKSK